MEATEITEIKALNDKLKSDCKELKLANEALHNALEAAIKGAHTLNDKAAEQLLLKIANEISMADYVVFLRKAEVLLFDFEFEWIIDAIISHD